MISISLDLSPCIGQAKVVLPRSADWLYMLCMCKVIRLLYLDAHELKKQCLLTAGVSRVLDNSDIFCCTNSTVVPARSLCNMMSPAAIPCNATYSVQISCCCDPIVISHGAVAVLSIVYGCGTRVYNGFLNSLRSLFLQVLLQRITRQIMYARYARHQRAPPSM